MLFIIFPNNSAYIRRIDMDGDGPGFVPNSLNLLSRPIVLAPYYIQWMRTSSGLFNFWVKNYCNKIRFVNLITPALFVA